MFRLWACALLVGLCSAAPGLGQATKLDGTYRIQVVGDARYLHEDSGGDKLISARYESDDDNTRFILEKQDDGSYRIKVKYSGRYWHEYSAKDRLISTRFQPDDDDTRFILEKQDDGSYRIKGKGSKRYLHEDGTNDKLLSTRYESNDKYTRFKLIPADGDSAKTPTADKPGQPTTYWLGRREGDKLVFDVLVPDFFVKLMKTKTDAGGSPFTRTIDGTKYTFYKQFFSWDEGGKSHPRGEYQQIRLDDHLTPQRDGEKWFDFDFKSQAKLTDALYGLKKSAGPGGAWYNVDALMVETTGTKPPGLTLNIGGLEQGTPFELGVAELANISGDQTVHEKCPQYTAFPNADGTIDVVWQDVAGKKIYVDQINPLKNTSKRLAAIDSLGLTAGAARSSKGEFYIATAERHKDQQEDKQIKVYAVSAGGSPRTLWSNTVQAPLLQGSARLALAEGANKLLLVFNLKEAHSHYALISSRDENQTTRAHETQWQHNFDQRVFFDGSDFVVVEKRDHNVSITLMKVNPGEKAPEKDGEWADRIRSVHPTSQWGNATYTELGQVVPGLDGGYLVLFASERDWDYKLGKGRFAPYWAKRTREQPAPPDYLSPRDLAAVHVVKDFDRQEPNWRDASGKWFTQSPGAVSTAGLVNSAGAGKRVKYRTADDGYDWPSYLNQNPPKDLAALARKQNLDESAWRDTERELTTQGVRWFTAYGEAAERDGSRATGGKEFTTVESPKLVAVGDGKYMAVWEEHACVLKQNDEFYSQTLKHVKTLAMTITLSREGGKVTVAGGEPVVLKGKPRLHWHDDAFAFDGGIAWITGDSAGHALVVHSVTPAGEYREFRAALP